MRRVELYSQSKSSVFQSSEKKRRVKQFQLCSWTSGQPLPETEDLLDLIDHVETWMKAGNRGSVIVHCM